MCVYIYIYNICIYLHKCIACPVFGTETFFFIVVCNIITKQQGKRKITNLLKSNYLKRKAREKDDRPLIWLRWREKQIVGKRMSPSTSVTKY